MTKITHTVLNYILIGTVAIVASSNSAIAGNLYAIIVADTNAAGIGEDAAESATLIESSIKGLVASENLKIATLKGNRVTRKSIEEAIDSIPKNAGHNAFFYYVGHGYYDKGSLLAPKSEGSKYIKMDDLIDRIKMRGVASSVSINDSCSKQPNGTRLAATPVQPEPKRNTPLSRGLFFGHNDIIHINSSAPGEYALSHQAFLSEGRETIVNGTPFAFAFMHAVNDTSKPLGWDKIIPEIAAETNRMFRETAPNGRLRLDGSIIQQKSQTVRGIRNGQYFP